MTSAAVKIRIPDSWHGRVYSDEIRGCMQSDFKILFVAEDQRQVSMFEEIKPPISFEAPCARRVVLHPCVRNS